MTFSLEPVVLRLKRADTPFFRVARRVYDFSSSASLLNFSNLWAACFMNGALASPWFGNDWNA
jgi:hypothetical protein